MYLAVSIFYVMVCAFLIFVVLLQQGRGGGMGALGGGSSQTVFGGAGAGNILTRITSVCAALFMVLSATLAYMSSSSDSTLDEISREIEARQAAPEISAPGTEAPAAEEAPAPEATPAAEPTEADEAPAAGQADEAADEAAPAADEAAPADADDEAL